MIINLAPKKQQQAEKVCNLFAEDSDDDDDTSLKRKNLSIEMTAPSKRAKFRDAQVQAEALKEDSSVLLLIYHFLDLFLRFYL